MSTIIDKLKDKFGNFVLPITNTKAVYDDDGNRLDNTLSNKQDKLNVGANIDITNNVISVKDVVTTGIVHGDASNTWVKGDNIYVTNRNGDGFTPIQAQDFILGTGTSLTNWINGKGDSGWVNDRLDSFKNVEDRCARYIGNLDDIVITSFYNTAPDDCTGYPPVQCWGFVQTLVHTHGNHYATQIFTTMNDVTTRMFIRQKIDHSWKEWYEITTHPTLMDYATARFSDISNTGSTCADLIAWCHDNMGGSSHHFNRGTNSQTGTIWASDGCYHCNLYVDSNFIFGTAFNSATDKMYRISHVKNGGAATVIPFNNSSEYGGVEVTDANSKPLYGQTISNATSGEGILLARIKITQNCSRFNFTMSCINLGSTSGYNQFNIYQNGTCVGRPRMSKNTYPESGATGYSAQLGDVFEFYGFQTAGGMSAAFGLFNIYLT